jgi:hypothetical protein
MSVVSHLRARRASSHSCWSIDYVVLNLRISVVFDVKVIYHLWVSWAYSWCFPFWPRVWFIAVSGNAVGAGFWYLYLLASRFLFPIRYLVTKSDLRCFVALAGILPIIRYARTRRFNTLGAILIASASVRFCSHACFWCDFDRTSECAILIVRLVLVQFWLHQRVCNSDRIVRTCRSNTPLP